MSDSLYDRDILEWTEQQSALLARLRRGERVNDAIDWDNLIEEIEALGRSECQACQSQILQALLHLIKIRLEPESRAANHWRSEVYGFIGNARRAFAPSMAQAIDLDELYDEASRRALMSLGPDQCASGLPASCPFTVADLTAARPEIGGLVARLSPGDAC